MGGHLIMVLSLAGRYGYALPPLTNGTRFLDPAPKMSPRGYVRRPSPFDEN